MKLKKQIQGFTLIELLIYISLVAISVMVLTAFTADSVLSAARALSVKEVNQNARLVLSIISQEIKTAKRIELPFTTTKLTLTKTNQANEEETFSFYLGADNIVYYDDDNDSNTDDIPISTEAIKVTQLGFEQVSANTVSVKINVQQKKDNPRAAEKYQAEFSSTVVPRQILY